MIEYEKIATDKNISLKGKGLFLTMTSLPKGFKFSIKSLSEVNKEGEKSIRNTLNELIRNGYITRSKILDSSRKFLGYSYSLKQNGGLK